MGATDSAKPEKDARLQTATRNPSPPPDRKSPRPPSKSPSPGSASGTTQSASPGDGISLEPGASASKPADPKSRQDLADAVSQGLTVECPDISGIPNGIGDSDLRRSPPVRCAIKVEFEGNPKQQAQHAKHVAVKSGQTDLSAQAEMIEDEAVHHRQGYWQAVAQRARQPTDSNMRWTAELHSRFLECVSQIGGPERATPKGIWKMMSVQSLTVDHVKSHLQKYRQSFRAVGSEQLETSRAASNANHHTLSMGSEYPPSQPDFSRPYSSPGFSFPSQPPPHAQRLSAADAEAQLFFMPHSSESLPAAAMMAPKPNGFVSQPPAPMPQRASSLQNQHLHAQHQQQQLLYGQQQRQQQLLAQQHYHQQMLMHQRLQQQQQSVGVSREQQLETLNLSQGFRAAHHHAQHAMLASTSQPPPSVSNSNGLSGPVHDSSSSQRANYGANGYSNHQQSASGQQQGQHAKHGANGFSNPSVQSGQPYPRSGSGASTAFIIWCDGQYKAKGQLEKRAALRNFVQAAKVGCQPL